MGFNPRTRTGCDPMAPIVPRITLQVSIHAPARGATRVEGTPLLVFRCFNPRTRTGCDRLGVWLPLSPVPFQSTHPHGVRLGEDSFQCGLRGVSIHAPARGATYCPVSVGTTPDVSIHAPARGATSAFYRLIQIV